MVEFQLPKLTTRVRFPSLAPFFLRRCSLKNAARALTVILPFLVTGCAAVYYPDPTAALVDQGRGKYHTVEKGETLWAISQIYQVDIDQLILLNNISDAGMIRKGQKIFIPGSRWAAPAGVPGTRAVPAAAPAPVRPRADIRTSDEFMWPVRGSLVSSFHGRDAGFWDQGIRVRTSPDVPVSATRRGTVVFVDDLTGYGQTVILDHMDGFMSVYAGRIQPVVRLGDIVGQEETVAVPVPGGSGFLYFEIRRHGEAANPLFYLPKS